MSEPLLVLRGIAKTYPGGVVAVDGADLELRGGEIVALCGENGAGKTTLATIGARKLAPTQGSVEGSTRVGLVHQHFELIDRLRVWENVMLGIEPRSGRFLDRTAARARVEQLAKDNALEIDPDAVVETLPVAIAQRVEILRELARDPEVLLLDEPTAALAPAEIDAFFATLRRLAARGLAILVITHKLQEVIAYASRVVVMRAGKTVAQFAISRTSVDEIARAMVGGELPPLAERAATTPAPALVVKGLHVGAGAHALRNASFEVRSGEIVGIAGVEGNGQSALADALTGAAPYTGTIELGGGLLRGGPGERIAAGLRAIPQDRLREALVPKWPIVDNVALGDQRSAFGRGGRFDRAAASLRAKEIVDRFDVRAPGLEASVATLSGGNQQKIVVGRALLGSPKVLVAYQPTRGIDVGAATLVQSRLIEARNAGVAVLLISFELDEIFALADRILVLFRGEIAGEFARSGFDRARIGALMAGVA